MLRLILVLLLTLGVAASGTAAKRLLTQITGEGICTPVPTKQPDQAEQQTTAAQPSQPATQTGEATTEPSDGQTTAAQPSQPAPRTGEATTEPSNRQKKAARPSQPATVKLLQTTMGRILEVENERIKARGRAVQVEHKRTGEVGYFLDYGGNGSISIIFGYTPNDEVRAKLVIVGDTNPTERYEYECRKK